MIALRIVLGAIVLVFGITWLLTAHVAAQCSSALGQLAQAVDQQAAAQCSRYGILHGVAGALAAAGFIGLSVALAVSRKS